MNAFIAGGGGGAVRRPPDGVARNIWPSCLTASSYMARNPVPEILSQEAVLLVMDKLKLSAANWDLLAELRHCVLLRDPISRPSHRGRGSVGSVGTQSFNTNERLFGS
jgi:hypothetical protein